MNSNIKLLLHLAIFRSVQPRGKDALQKIKKNRYKEGKTR